MIDLTTSVMPSWNYATDKVMTSQRAAYFIHWCLLDRHSAILQSSVNNFHDKYNLLQMQMPDMLNPVDCFKHV